jgi:hypothetical protein
VCRPAGYVNFGCTGAAAKTLRTKFLASATHVIAVGANTGMYWRSATAYVESVRKNKEIKTRVAICHIDTLHDRLNKLRKVERKNKTEKGVKSMVLVFGSHCLTEATMYELVSLCSQFNVHNIVFCGVRDCLPDTGKEEGGLLGDSDSVENVGQPFADLIRSFWLPSEKITTLAEADVAQDNECVEIEVGAGASSSNGGSNPFRIDKARFRKLVRYDSQYANMIGGPLDAIQLHVWPTGFSWDMIQKCKEVVRSKIDLVDNDEKTYIKCKQTQRSWYRQTVFYALLCNTP